MQQIQVQDLILEHCVLVLYLFTCANLFAVLMAVFFCAPYSASLQLVLRFSAIKDSNSLSGMFAA